MFAQSATTTIAIVVSLLVAAGWVLYYLLNRSAARPELGSEVEMAPNRKPYYTDEELEGPRLERMQVLAFLLLVVVVIGLPLYWWFEPSRQAGAVEGKQEKFESWGAELFASTADGGFNCAGCHGGMNANGGVAPFSVTNPQNGDVQAVSWAAPALNTIYYRFDKSEVEFILNYGRPFSPMSAWGAPGGGPMTTQQIETLQYYLRSIQIQPIGCIGDAAPFNPTTFKVCDGGQLPEDKRSEIDTAIDQAAQQLVADGKYATANQALGEAVFNLNLASGAYSCARCHTQGWSYGQPRVTGQGAYGWNLTAGSVNAHFANTQDLVSFIGAGSQFGARYGLQGQGSGRMPGFASMLTPEQLRAVVDYIRSL
jgi:mono/diheme cytochrome c family protein